MITYSPFGPRSIEDKVMSPNDLMVLGIQDVAYIKPVIVDGDDAYGIYSADGQELGYADGRDLAFATVRHNDMEPVSVH